VEYTILDVETTGFRTTDHVIEIAARRMQLDGTIIAEFETLVNPGRSVTDTTHIHGISDRHLVGAPAFPEVAGDLDEFISQSVVVGHNVGFDIRFIRQEMARIEVDPSRWPALCTMRLSPLRGGPGRSTLENCHGSFGCAPVEGAHRASVDVGMTSEIFLAMLAGSNEETFRSLGTCDTPEWSAGLPSPCVELPASGLRHTREQLPADATISAVAATGDGAREACLALYRGALEAALEDRLLEPHEIDGLISLGTRLGVSPEQVLSISQSYFEGVVARAIADRRIDETEQRDLDTLARLFELDSGTVERLIATATPASADDEDLEGLSVCFTGGVAATRNGIPLTRADLQASAEGRGMIVKSGVSKKLDILVTSDPHSMSGKSEKARELGTRVVGVDVFIGRLGIVVD
jgi:DNA polymerase-3 subunit epsilon